MLELKWVFSRGVTKTKN